ncbi:MAG TPA: Lrp/AsnC family transcriptional regulator [Anaerolineales bacterium]
MYNFDRIDVQIVNMLLEDGRMPASAIARRVGASERVVRYRIDQMVENAVIQVSAVVNPEAFGLTIKADVWLEVDSDQIPNVARRLAKFDTVTYVASGIGGIDISIQLVAADTQEIYHFVTEVVRKIPGVRRTTTSIVPIIIKDVYQWRVPERVVRQTASRQPVRTVRPKAEGS